MEYSTKDLAAKLIEQKYSHDSLVKTLEMYIGSMESSKCNSEDELHIYYKFFTTHGKELLPQLVEFFYKEDGDKAASMIGCYHDETLDLSTMDCTGSDFKSW